MAPVTSFFSINAAADYDGDGQVKTAFEEIGTISAGGSSGTGLFGQVIAALNAKGIYYNPNSYPYFFTSTGGQFNAWTTHTLSAAFNLVTFTRREMHFMSITLSIPFKFSRIH